MTRADLLSRRWAGSEYQRAGRDGQPRIAIRGCDGRDRESLSGAGAAEGISRIERSHFDSTSSKQPARWQSLATRPQLPRSSRALPRRAPRPARDLRPTTAEPSRKPSAAGGRSGPRRAT